MVQIRFVLFHDRRPYFNFFDKNTHEPEFKYTKSDFEIFFDLSVHLMTVLRDEKSFVDCGYSFLI